MKRKLSRIHQIYHILFGKKVSVLERQQNITFSLYITAVIIGQVANMLGLTGPSEAHIMQWNYLFGIITLIPIVGLLTKKIDLPHAFAYLTIITQFFTCNEMIQCAKTPNSYYVSLIIGNMFLLAVNMLFAVIAYLRIVPHILGAMSCITYIICMVMTNDYTLYNFAILYIVVFLVITILGSLLVRNINRLNEENNILKQEMEEEEELIHLLKTERKQIKAYIRLARERYETVETDKLLDLFSDDVQQNVLHNVSEAMMAKEARLNVLAEIFPTFTPSEMDIARLVIRGKSLKEVCDLLGKTESNITCQRANIRRKLGMKSNENLRKVLQEKIIESKKHKE